MKEKKTLVMATNNAAKLREARAIAGNRIEILSLGDVGFDRDIAETAATLEGNALLKARTVREATGMDCFADDTGLLVDALGGAPGVYSARYAGEACDPEANIDLLLHNLGDTSDRRARFRTAIALIDAEGEHLFEGNTEGEIANARSGSHGFGYDPVFISEETGRSFAEMTEEEKNGISHRGRALRSMMKWLGALCLAFLAWLPANADLRTDWAIHSTFDDEIEKVYDTPEKTYYLVQAQLYDPKQSDNNEKLFQLWCLEKESDETRPYNSGNFLSRDVIRNAAYNAGGRYLLLVYDDYTIELLDDDGKTHTITGLKNYASATTKEVRDISFDPARNRAYLSTDFGFLAIDDKKYGVAESGIYNTPVDKAARAGDFLIILRDGALYKAAADANHNALENFRPADWTGGDKALNLVALSADKCLISKEKGGEEQHFLLTFTPGSDTPEIKGIGSFQGADIVENRDGLLLSRTSQLVQINRETGAYEFFPRRPSGEDYAVKCGSWDLREIFYAKPRLGFYSVSRSPDNEYAVTREMARPNGPAPFRTDNFLYTPQFGMLANTHGINSNFGSHGAPNFVLLSSLQDGEWTMHGLPYLKAGDRYRLLNPIGLAQDPDNPDLIYMGSISNGLLRYNITDYSDVLHITRSNDNPGMEGHVSAGEPYPLWTTYYPVQNPMFDRDGNMVAAHVWPSSKDKSGSLLYDGEIWVWTPEARKASTSPETYRPMKQLTLKDAEPQRSALALALKHSASRGLVVYIPIQSYKRPITVYDHRSTIEDESDDRQAQMRQEFNDGGEKVEYEYFRCAIEDPETGLVWVGTNDGVFTFKPADAFTSPGTISRIKVSRNDGTSLADYLLKGAAVSHIAIDGKGRKWFSLAGGGIVVTSADGRTILEEITEENSMLPSDVVYAACYNPATNSMMIGTQAGIAEYFMTDYGSGSSTASEIKVFPNPVRPEYYGYVTIEGLEDGALVKIVDAAGKLVRELGPASGGTVTWDASGSDLKRVGSGVYYVLASSGKSSESGFSEVSKVLVMSH